MYVRQIQGAWSESTGLLYIAALFYHIWTEEYDRTFPGYVANNEWIPVKPRYDRREHPSSYARRVREACVCVVGPNVDNAIARIAYWSLARCRESLDRTDKAKVDKVQKALEAELASKQP